MAAESRDPHPDPQDEDDREVMRVAARALAASLEACRQYAVDLLADAERAIACRNPDATRAAQRGLRRAVGRLAQIASQAPAFVAFADDDIARQLCEANRVAVAYDRLATDLPWPVEPPTRTASSLSSSQTLPTRVVYGSDHG